MCGFIAQLVEHRTGIAEVTGSNPVEALIFFQASSFQLLSNCTSRRRVFSTFLECSQMTGVFYHSVIHGLGFFNCFKI